ncbi:hypothetical protein ACFUIZ_34610 [Streptomyces cinereoruber]|uniref:hypothetical protein n=1 Tax=Streptomyces cinereoruber TaxID=67260 RepID=UPI003643CD6D
MTEQDATDTPNPGYLAYDSAEVDCYALIRAAKGPETLALAIADTLDSLVQRHPGQRPADLRIHLGGAIVWIASVFLHFASIAALEHADGPGRTTRADRQAAADALVLGLAQAADEHHPDAAPVQRIAYRSALALAYIALFEVTDDKPLSSFYRRHHLGLMNTYGSDGNTAHLNAIATAARDLAVFAAIGRGLPLEDMLIQHQLIAIETQELEREDGEWDT